MLFAASGYLCRYTARDPSVEGVAAVVVSGADEVAPEVVDVALLVHEVLLVLALDLDALEPLGGQVLGIIDVDHILILLLWLLLLVVV